MSLRVEFLSGADADLQEAYEWMNSLVRCNLEISRTAVSNLGSARASRAGCGASPQ
jgi:hypothetical protein